MAHELSIRADGRAEMAFTGETPWHGLGQSIPLGAPVDEWVKAAGMDWEALEGTPGIIRLADVHKGLEATIDFPAYKGLYRSDTLKPLAIVGAGYNVVQPRQVLEFFRDMTEEGGWHIHTAGVLRDGRKLWAMASRNVFAPVQRRRKAGQTDEVAHNLLFATSLDGSMKTTVQDTAVRVVCANTLALALRDGDRAITITHRSVFDEAAVKRALGLADDSFDRFMSQARDLADTPCDAREATALLKRVFRVEDEKKPSTAWLGSLKDMAAKADEGDGAGTGIQRILALFEGAGMGANLPEAAGTRWGLLNAVTEHVDWDMGRTADTRLDSAWFGRGSSIKQDALRVLTEA